MKPPKPPPCIAHRGNTGYTPENTLAYAELGIDGILTNDLAAWSQVWAGSLNTLTTKTDA
jgi:hypothetical protein